MSSTPATEVDQSLQEMLAGFVSQKEAAKLLNLHPAALRARVQRGRIASVRAGSAILIPRTEIERVRRTYIPPTEE